MLVITTTVGLSPMLVAYPNIQNKPEGAYMVNGVHRNTTSLGP